MKKLNRKSIYVICCIIMLVTFFCGCRQSLSPLDYVKSLEPGVTNRGEVLEVLGEPIEDIGSGVYIDVYEIEGHTINIGYVYHPVGTGFENHVVNFITIDGETYRTWDNPPGLLLPD